MYTKPTTFRDQDFYCSFTHLPNSINAEELPYTIHSPYSIARLRTIPSMYHHHRRTPSGALRPDSFDSANTTSTTRSFRSFMSWTSSHRKRKLLAKVKQLFRTRKESQATLEILRCASRKPSTLDFRCIGTESRMDLGMFATPVYEGVKPKWEDDGEGPFEKPPKIEVELPGEKEGGNNWGRGWFDEIC
ncbi:hypothetical protein BDD12DRAFT_814265 [Trichophaea hybrida]|nr:hypothetical protein BDD12DRAFT_814265 [Trichophaea hybrida]